MATIAGLEQFTDLETIKKALFRLYGKQAQSLADAVAYVGGLKPARILSAIQPGQGLLTNDQREALAWLIVLNRAALPTTGERDFNVVIDAALDVVLTSVAKQFDDMQVQLTAVTRYDAPRIMAAIIEIGLPEQPKHIDALITHLERLVGDLMPESPFRQRFEAQLLWLQQERYLGALDVIIDSRDAADGAGEPTFIITRLANMGATRLHEAIDAHHSGTIYVLVVLGAAAEKYGISIEVAANARETLDRL